MTSINKDEFMGLEKVETKLMINKKFEVTNGASTTTLTILDNLIQKLHSIALIDSSAFIVAYLPTKIEKTTKKGNDAQTTDWENRAYFVANVKGHPVRRQIFPFDDDYLTKNYSINVIPTWQVRWDPQDVQKYLKEKEPTEPQLLFNLLKEKAKFYLEFENESSYDFFVLWSIGTYFHILFDAYPYVDLLGTKRAGKTKALEFLKLTCFNAIMSPDLSSASMFRLIELTNGTILLDETEQFKNQKLENAQHVRILLNQGFLKDQHAYRVSKDTFQPESYDLFSPKALAHINSFDDVLEDRCIQIIMRRSTNKGIQDTYPNDSDLDFSQIRNLSYRLFLDYVNEINGLKIEAQKLLPVSGREKLLWIPIITLALFFERHGVEKVVASVIALATASSKGRQLTDEQDNLDYRIVNYLETQITEQGWKTISDLYKSIVEREEEYQINSKWFTRSKLSETLKRLGMMTERKESGISWLISKEEVEAVKKRLGIGAEKTTEPTSSTETTTLE